MEHFFDQMSDSSSPMEFSEEEITLESILKANLESKSSAINLSGIQISELPNIFSTLDYIKVLNAYDIGLQSLKNLPPNLIELEVSCNQIKRITRELPSSLEVLDINRCQLEFIEYLPPKIRKLDVSYNTLFELPALGDNLISLDASNNFIWTIDNLPDSIESLFVHANKIEIINKLPNKLKRFIAYNNKIKEIKYFPDDCEDIDLDFNNLKIIPTLPSKLINFTATENLITDVNLCDNKLPDNLMQMELRRNPLTNVSNIITDSPFVKISEDVVFLNPFEYSEEPFNFSEKEEKTEAQKLKERIKELKPLYVIELYELIRV